MSDHRRTTPLDLPIDVPSLAPQNVGGRIGRLRESFDGIDGLVVTAPVHLRYLFGFTGSAGVGWIDRDQSLLVTDARYRLQAPEECAAGDSGRVQIEITRAAIPVLSARAATVDRVGLEAGHLTWADAMKYTEAFGEERVVPTTGVVEQRRATKDAGEIARIEAAAAVTDAALAEVIPHLRPGATEVEVARRIEASMVHHGASGPAYETIVASGPNGANPHARPGERRFEPGDLVVIDAGALVDGYRSDMTRTFCLGPPDAQTQRMLDVVTGAQAAGVSGVAPGVQAQDIDRRCREVIGEAGWADAFEHGTGHGVGLDIHEAPAVNQRSGDVLETGQVLTVEPGVYFAGYGGVRVEDLLLVTDDGARPLTVSPKEPILTLE